MSIFYLQLVNEEFEKDTMREDSLKLNSNELGTRQATDKCYKQLPAG